MKVSVIGPGALGCLFAARLANSGVNTTLIDYKPDRISRLQDLGIVVESDGGTISAKPNISAQVPNGQNLVIVLIKAYSTDKIKLPTDVPVLTLQNGLNNVEGLCTQVGSSRVLAGVTSEAATLLDEGRTLHTYAGLTQFGAWTSCPTSGAIEILQKAGFEVELTNAPGQVIWEKVAINAGINPLTALLDVSNGRLLDVREIRELMRNLVVEAAKVASTEGYRFEHSLVEKAEDICRLTSNNISSMLQDIRAGKQTEIDSISGEILNRATQSSLPCPRTRVIYQLIKGLEKR